jgi:hypothetical protein
MFLKTLQNTKIKLTVKYLIALNSKYK